MAKATFIVGLLAVFAASVCADTCKHECVSHNEFKLNNLILPCADKYACVVEYPKCTPCVLETTKCSKLFRCTTKPGDIIIGGLTLQCPENTECNKRGLEDCKPCLPKKCENINWKCGEDLSKVTYMNMEFTCADNTECNNNYVEPCNPCIKK